MQFLRSFTSCLIAGLMLFSIQASAAQLETAAKPIQATSQNTMIVDLNTATSDELQTLKGIGASKAQAIIAYRTEQGKFKSVEDLGNIKGFSEKTLKKLIEQNPDRMTVSP